MTGPTTIDVAITIGGSALKPTSLALLDSATVDQSTWLPSGVELVFHDPYMTVLTDNAVGLGTALAVSVRARGATAALFTGEVTQLNMRREEDGASLTVIRGMDLLHRLQQGRTTRAFRNVTVADVVQTVLQQNQIPLGRVSSTGGVRPQISQVDESDWQLLRRLGTDIGHVLSLREGKGDFGPPARGAGTAVEVRPGDNLLQFDAELSSDVAARNVVVRGWDMRTKKAVEGSSQVGQSQAPVADRRAWPGGRRAREVRRTSSTVISADHATAIAKGVAADLATTSGEVHALISGDTRVIAGGAITLVEVPDAFAGTFTVRSARHDYRRGEGYTVAVVAGSHRDRSLLGTVGAAAAPGRRAEGVWVAVVSGLADPDNLGRVKLTFPWLDSAYESDWARVVHLGAGPKRGLLIMPEVNDEVLVAFEDADPDRPVVIGGLYGKDQPDRAGLVNGATRAVDRRTFVSRSGHRLDLVDSKGSEAVTLSTGDGNVSVTLTQQTGDIAITTKKGGIVLDAATSLELKSKGTLKIGATGPVEIKGAIIKLN